MPPVPRYISGRDSFATSVRYTPSNWFIYVGVSELVSAKADEREWKGKREEEKGHLAGRYTGFSGIS